jgi:hypothetical protein
VRKKKNHSITTGCTLLLGLKEHCFWGILGVFLVPDPAKRHERRGAVPRLIMRMTPSGGVSFENMGISTWWSESRISLIPHEIIINAIDDNVPSRPCFFNG